MRNKRRLLMGVLLFNGVSAVGGGLALMTGLIPEQAHGFSTPTSAASTFLVSS